MSQHGYMRYTATPPLVLDLIRLIQSAGTAVEPIILHYSSMTLNDLERRNSLYFAFFSPNSIVDFAFFSPNSIVDWLVDWLIISQWLKIMSVKYCLPVPVFQFWPKLTHPAARSLCDS